MKIVTERKFPWTRVAVSPDCSVMFALEALPIQDFLCQERSSSGGFKVETLHRLLHWNFPNPGNWIQSQVLQGMKCRSFPILTAIFLEGIQHLSPCLTKDSMQNRHLIVGWLKFLNHKRSIAPGSRTKGCNFSPSYCRIWLQP